MGDNRIGKCLKKKQLTHKNVKPLLPTQVDLNIFSDIVHYPLGAMCHKSHVLCHMSHATCHMSYVMCTCQVRKKMVELVGGGSVINWAYPALASLVLLMAY